MLGSQSAFCLRRSALARRKRVFDLRHRHNPTYAEIEGTNLSDPKGSLANSTLRFYTVVDLDS